MPEPKKEINYFQEHGKMKWRAAHIKLDEVNQSVLDGEEPWRLSEVEDIRTLLHEGKLEAKGDYWVSPGCGVAGIIKDSKALFGCGTERNPDAKHYVCFCR